MADANAIDPDTSNTSGARLPPPVAAGAIEYSIDGAFVKVTWKCFRPCDTARPLVASRSDTAIFLLPGWGYTELATPTAAVSQAFADVSGNVVYAVDTYTERAAQHIAQREAQATTRFIQTVSASRRILVGQSQGAWAAMCIAASCTDVAGLVLVDAMGLVSRPLGGFLKDYVRENVNSSFLAEYPAQSRYDENDLRAANALYLKEGFGELARQIRLAGGVLPYIARLSQEIKGMIVRNPCAHELALPIVIVNGERDRLSRPDRIIPAEHPGKRASPYLVSMTERERYLQSHVFPKSPYVRMIVARKMGYHGLVAFRPLEVACSSLYLLERWDRAATRR
jgi:pimeloyl-ACP methyl ester carboxylesterase